MDLNLKDRVALITGGSKGIGQAIALQLAKEGCNIGICARGASQLDETIEKLTLYGIKAHGVIADVTVPSQVEAFVKECATVLGGIDYLVGNAGGVLGGSLLESTPLDWQQTFELNFFHCVNAIRASVPFMQQRGSGSIVLISSISAKKASPRAQYGCAKAAQIYLAESLARELAEYKIRVNSLSPGSTYFPGGGWDKFKQVNPDWFADFEQRDFPSKRLATPEEIAEVVAFILSDRANWINGTDIPVDGAQLRPSARGY
ncbi:MAG TPA: SDR family oxidoreductase [Leptolyngbyaceae cyanobacterium]